MRRISEDETQKMPALLDLFQKNAQNFCYEHDDVKDSDAILVTKQT